MCCITSVAQETTMATTQLRRAVRYEVRWTGQEGARVEALAPRMNWVVVTDENQNRRMKMCWHGQRATADGGTPDSRAVMFL